MDSLHIKESGPVSPVLYVRINYVTYSRFPNLHYRYITKQPAAVGIELELSPSVFNRIEAVKKVNGINITETTPVKTIIRMY